MLLQASDRCLHRLVLLDHILMQQVIQLSIALQLRLDLQLMLRKSVV